MTKLIGFFLALVMLALFSSGCAGTWGGSAGFPSEEGYGYPGFTVNEQHDLEYYQMYGY